MITWKKTKSQKDKIFWTQLLRDVQQSTTSQRARPSNPIERKYYAPAHHFLA